MADSAAAIPHGAAPAPDTRPGQPAPTWVTARPGPPLVRPLRPATARRVGLAAIAMGLLIESLFVGQLAGLNVPIVVAALLGAAAVLAPRPLRIRRSDAWLPVAALAFAGLVALRAAPPIVAFDVVAAALLTAATMAALSGAAITSRSLSGIATLVGQGMAVTGGGSVRLGSSRHPVRARGTWGMGPGTRSVLVGLGVAVPVVALFAALFASADAIFGALVADLFDIRLDLGDLPGRLLIAGGAAWVVGGLLVLLVAATARVRRAPAPIGATLGAVEATVVLVCADAVFATFVIIQAGYLFGGLDTVAASGLGYAQYARRGFFELVAVALLAGVVVVGLESLVTDRRRAYRGAALALVRLTGAVLLSAGVRMSLYQDAYGWSELRFFVAAAIVWLALCLVAAATGVARGSSRSLPAAVGILALVVALGVNAADPGAFIADQNLRRAADPAAVPPGGSSGLDAEYLAGLGADAVPVLVEALPTLPPRDRAKVESALLAQRSELADQLGSTGWPSWNRAREQAWQALAALPGRSGAGQPGSP